MRGLKLMLPRACSVGWLGWGWGGAQAWVSLYPAPILGHLARPGCDCSEMEFLGQNQENRCLREEAKNC